MVRWAVSVKSTELVTGFLKAVAPLGENPTVEYGHYGRIAVFSECDAYRYLLIIPIDQLPLDKSPTGEVKVCAFCMLNPSTADEFKNDPTVERCYRRAKEWGAELLIVVNAFAFRATDPEDMKKIMECAVGPLNDAAIQLVVEEADPLILGWGVHGKFLDRQSSIMNIIAGAGKDAYCLGKNLNGTPKHPLYVGYNVELERV